MVARFGYMVNKWTVTAVAALALMAVVLATALPAWAQSDNGLERDYAENGTDPVATFTAVDPEGRTVYWSLLTELSSPAPEVLTEPDIADASDFSISMDGVLNFKSPPSFESPMGAGTPMTNTYKAVVVSSDDAAGVTGRKMAYHRVTVNVTDEDEDGSISLSAQQQPQVGVELRATLTDQDARSIAADPIINTTWKWEQSTAMNGPWTLIPGAGDNDTSANNTPGSVVKASDGYSPVKTTAGMYLRATVTYTDKHGDNKTAMAITANMVRAKPAGTNASPTFTDENTADATIQVSRKVKENAPPGTPVGTPVIVTDVGDVLTYSLSGTDNAYFAIDRATGQITVKKKLNYELDDGADGQCADANACEVSVTATDPWGIVATDTPTPPEGTTSATIQTVNITVENVNEAPKVSEGPTKTKQAENGVSTLTPDEDDDAAIVTTYKATDPESDETGDICSGCIWSVSGPDSSLFKIDKSGTAAETVALLTFKNANAPNFEAPADNNGDNVYEVTVEVTDDGVNNRNKMSATRNVMIIVTNVNEGGKVTYSSVRPKVGIPFTASLSDPDGETMDVEWEWKRTISGTDATTDCSADGVAFDMDIDEDSDTYTPRLLT